jgi:pimeloyl-ACP methyl ester carboxylesterase
VSFPVDFAAITRFCETYRVMRYETPGQIQAKVGAGYDEFALVDLPATRNRYMIGTLLGARRQEIWIRGTANFRNALFDLRIGMHHNEKLGINLHHGFEMITVALYQDIMPRLRKDFDIVVFGHSLGAAEAVVLGMLLDVDHYRVAKIYASGQPRVTDAAGEKAFDHLPILRIVNVDDPVPCLPPRAIDSRTDPYVHIGPALVLLNGPYYALIGEDQGDEVLAGAFWPTLEQEGLVEPVMDHLIPAYLGRLTPKLAAAEQVPWADRGSYH